jgi:hypothetical protein
MELKKPSRGVRPGNAARKQIGDGKRRKAIANDKKGKTVEITEKHQGKGFTNRRKVVSPNIALGAVGKTADCYSAAILVAATEPL